MFMQIYVIPLYVTTYNFKFNRISYIYFEDSCLERFIVNFASQIIPVSDEK